MARLYLVLYLYPFKNCRWQDHPFCHSVCSPRGSPAPIRRSGLTAKVTERATPPQPGPPRLKPATCPHLLQKAQELSSRIWLSRTLWARRQKGKGLLPSEGVSAGRRLPAAAPLRHTPLQRRFQASAQTAPLHPAPFTGTKTS